MSRLQETINVLVQPLNEERRLLLGRPPGTDMSHSNQCQYLTSDMMEALANRDLPAKREYHEGANGTWHYLLNHTPLDQPPTDEDLITDLNPWQGLNDPSKSGILHGQRREVMEQMQASGVPGYLVALRGLETIVRLHVSRR